MEINLIAPSNSTADFVPTGLVTIHSINRFLVLIE